MKTKIPRKLDSIENPLLRFFIGKYLKSESVQELCDLEGAMHSLGYVFWCPEVDEQRPRSMKPIFRFDKLLPEETVNVKVVILKLPGVRELSDIDCSDLRRIW